jgi:hypothetical protein
LALTSPTSGGRSVAIIAKHDVTTNSGEKQHKWGFHCILFGNIMNETCLEISVIYAEICNIQEAIYNVL